MLQEGWKYFLCYIIAHWGIIDYPVTYQVKIYIFNYQGSGYVALYEEWHDCIYCFTRKLSQESLLSIISESQPHIEEDINHH